MTIRNAIPMIWAAGFLVALRKSLVYGDVVNTDYEGLISQQGDSVKILTVGRPTVKKYVPNVTEIVPEKITTAEQFLVITEADYFAIEIDNVDRRQAVPGLLEAAADEGAYAMRDMSDQFLASKYTEVAAGNNLGTVSITTPAAAIDLLSGMMVKLDTVSVPYEGRWTVVPPWFHGLLTDSDEFVGATPEEALINGRVGRAKGFDIRMSNNTPNPTGDDWAILGGIRAAMSYAEQIPVDSTKFYEPEDSFSDALKTLHVYGGKVVRPDCLTVALASQT